MRKLSMFIAILVAFSVMSFSPPKPEPKTISICLTSNTVSGMQSLQQTMDCIMEQTGSTKVSSDYCLDVSGQYLGKYVFTSTKIKQEVFSPGMKFLPRTYTDCYGNDLERAYFSGVYQALLLWGGSTIDNVSYFDGPSIYAPKCVTITYHGGDPQLPPDGI